VAEASSASIVPDSAVASGGLVVGVTLGVGLGVSSGGRGMPQAERIESAIASATQNLALLYCLFRLIVPPDLLWPDVEERDIP
jgi:hypothetical protein